MNIQYASDLHLEFPDNARLLAEHPLQPVGNVLLLAGDIHIFGHPGCRQHPFFDWCADHFDHTFIVPGNHEFYGGYPLDDSLNNFEMALRPNVKYVNNRRIALSPDIDLFPTTLWSSIAPQDEPVCNSKMTDFRTIRYQNAPFRACHYKDVHECCLTWLSTALQSSTATHKIVLTHHCPARIEDPKYSSNGLSTAFVNPLENFVAHSGALLWIFGHTHYNGGNGTTFNTTTLRTNQFGYVADGVLDGFQRNATIRLT